jgi:branched-chain amino acid aminotransferase
MSLKIYISGKLYDKDDAKISVYDHGLLYGDGVFEGLRSYGGRVFRLEQHLTGSGNRPRPSGWRFPSPREMAKAVVDTWPPTSITDGYIRLVVTRGAGSAWGSTPIARDPQVIIIADIFRSIRRRLYDQGLEIVTVSTSATIPAALSPRIKSLNYLNNILAKIEGLQAGCIEALMLNHKGEVAECTGDNIFLVRGGVLLTPPVDAGILEGITREAVIELARAPASRSAKCRSPSTTCTSPTNAFLTGTAAEVIRSSKSTAAKSAPARPARSRAT